MFDFDDTLVESEAIKDTIFQKIFRRYPKSAKAAWEFHRQNGSLPRGAKFAWLASHAFPDDEPLQKSCVKECLEQFQKKTRVLVGDAEEVSGVEEMLAGLFGKIPLYIASVNPQQELDFLIHRRGWQKWFSAWYGNPPFPKDQALKEIASRENTATQQLLLIGDSPGDREAAEKAGSQVWLRNKGDGHGIWKDGLDLARQLSAVLSKR